ncbi:MAG TPA: hypothetical protein PLN52_07760 [Opitutaceae bacterium]|nr:hypothetical protein [Opitutaceae bacterium]
MNLQLLTLDSMHGWGGRWRLRVARVLICGLIASTCASAGHAAARNPGQDWQLLVDRSLVSSTKGLAWVQHESQSAGVALRSDRPWEGDALYISSIYYLDGEYRMLYRGLDVRVDGESSYLCLARSRDGIHWEKPELGLIEFDGTRANNIIADAQGRRLGMCYTFLDPRPGTPANERVKAIAWTDGKRYYHWARNNKGNLKMVLLASANGEVFQEMEGYANTLRSDRPNAFDGGSIFWSAEEQCFVGYLRWWDEGAAPHPRSLQDWMIVHPGTRSVFRVTSKDLRSWSEAVPMSFGQTPREHIYESSTHPYFRSPQLYLALANRFNPGRRGISDTEALGLRIRTLPNSGGGPRYDFTRDVNDLILMTTRPGTAVYERPFMEAFMRPGVEPGNWGSRSNYAPQHGGLIRTGRAEMSFLVTRQHLQPGNHIERRTLRLDGLTSLRAPYAHGEFTSVPLLCSGDRLELNYSTSGVGEVQVEIQDEAGEALPGFSLNDCVPLIGDRISGGVAWKAESSLRSLRGRSVRIRMVLSDADIYSFRFAEDPR